MGLSVADWAVAIRGARRPAAAAAAEPVLMKVRLLIMSRLEVMPRRREKRLASRRALC